MKSSAVPHYFKRAVVDTTLDQMLVMQEEKTRMLPWNKLDKSLRFKKIMEFAAEFAETNLLTEEKTIELKMLLRDKLQRKEMHKTKDVVYDLENGKVKHIPALSYADGVFTFKVIDRASPLNSLAPKNKTVRKDIKTKD